MNIESLEVEHHFDRVQVADEGGRRKTTFTCPVCGRRKVLKFKDFSSAHTASPRRVFDPGTEAKFSNAGPLKRINSTAMGKTVSLLLEFPVDFLCRRCRTPYRVVFAPLESTGGASYYLVKSLLGPVPGG